MELTAILFSCYFCHRCSSLCRLSSPRLASARTSPASAGSIRGLGRLTVGPCRLSRSLKSDLVSPFFLICESPAFPSSFANSSRPELTRVFLSQTALSILSIWSPADLSFRSYTIYRTRGIYLDGRLVSLYSFFVLAAVRIVDAFGVRGFRLWAGSIAFGSPRACFEWTRLSLIRFLSPCPPPQLHHPGPLDPTLLPCIHAPSSFLFPIQDPAVCVPSPVLPTGWL